MKTLEFASAAALEPAAGRWLARDGRTNNLILGRIRDAGDSGRAWLVTAHDEPRLALLATAPYAVLSGGSLEAAEYLAESIDTDLPGFVGPAEVADTLGAGWRKRTGVSLRVGMEMTFYTLDRMEAFTSPAGILRPAALAELDRLTPLAIAAELEMGLAPQPLNHAAIEASLLRAIEEQRQFVWADDDEVCAIASYVSVLDHAGARIRGVYTPPEQRGRGYGTAVTGALAGRLLNAGQAWIGLFADNANPISTGIYRRLGFRPHSVFRTWQFA